MKKEDRKKLYKLIEEWTRLDIISRLLPLENQFRLFPNSHVVTERIDREDEIRKLMFGTDNLTTLGLQWGILKPYTKKEKKRLSEKQKENNRATQELLDYFDNPSKAKQKKKIKRRHSGNGKSKKNKKGLSEE